MIGLSLALVLATGQHISSGYRDMKSPEIAARLKALGYTFKSDNSFEFVIQDGRRSEVVFGPIRFGSGRAMTPEEESNAPPCPLTLAVFYYLPRYLPREIVKKWSKVHAPEVEISSMLDGSILMTATLDGEGNDWALVIEKVRREASLFESQMLAGTEWVSNSRIRKVSKAEDATVMYTLNRGDMSYLAQQWGWEKAKDESFSPDLCFKVDDCPVGIDDEGGGKILLESAGVVGVHFDPSTVKWADTAREPDNVVRFFKSIDPSAGISLGELRRVVRQFADRVHAISAPITKHG